MVAAENDALPGAKVGGVGDVLRDLPLALCQQGLAVDVLIPSYGFLARLPGLEKRGTFDIVFAGVKESVTLFLAAGESGVGNYIFHHAAFSPQGEKVYCNDDYHPFATDAGKYAFFCLAVLEAIKQQLLPRPDVFHCHDWHAAFVPILLRYDAAFSEFADIPTVFTIHNLAMQGVRPFKHDNSSLEHWYPHLQYEGAYICDTQNPFCLNPMRAAIRLSTKVHTVSPTYAQEILRPSDHSQGVYGGEGLEQDLQERHQSGDLIGIINGCDYPKNARYAAPAKKKILHQASQSLVRWASKSRALGSAHFVADKRLQQWATKKSRGFNLTYVGRLTEQKVRLLTTRVQTGRTALEEILSLLGEHGQFIMLGSGSSGIENFLTGVSGEFSNFIFLNGYAADLSSSLYRYGDLFLMPSSFEPCGISQMLAMRAGQPCLVNAVGGLKDTIIANQTGFCFHGSNAAEQAEQMLVEFGRLLNGYLQDPAELKAVAANASEVRFDWHQVATSYMNTLYN